MKRLEEVYLENREEYQRRLEYYRRVLKRKRLHMLAADSVKLLPTVGTDRGDMRIWRVREEVFLYVWLPVLTEYVEWVLGEAVKNGKKRLYFLARDGYMMYLMAKMLVDAKGIDLDIRYLKISRFSIRNAEYYFVGKAALDTLCVGGIDISFEKIMKRANLTEEEALHIARLAGYTKKYKKVLSYQQLCRLKKELSGIGQLFVYIKKHAQNCYNTTVSYLRQEGLLEETSYVLVDSGWVGTLQLSLQRVLEHEKAGKVSLQGYYFGLYARPEGTDADQYMAFYFGAGEILRKIRFSNCLFETVFSAPEGMTQGYRLKEQELQESIYEAVENDSRNPNADVMEHFVKLLIQYASCYGETSDDRGATSHKKRVSFAENLLNPMMGNPTQWEAEAFGALLFCDDVLELQLQPVAAWWDEEELYKQRFFNKILIKLNLKSGILHESAWAEGSIARFGKKAGSHMRQERLYKSFMYLRKAIHK
ncbi:MAG: hypothetical protein K2O65_02585 [Lachnospiraceae bacterium]|nr:hypothetical protein [Lachnospiraceae bacterium]